MPAEDVKNLGVTFDLEESFDSHVGTVCCACYYHLRDLQHNHKVLTLYAAVLLANAMVSRQLDYCNFLLNGVGKS